MSRTSPTIKCPGCGTMIAYRSDNPFRPFCGERCKMIDLGAWAADRYVIPGPRTEPDGNDGTPLG